MAYNFIWKPIDKVLSELHRFSIRLSAYSKGYKKIHAYKLEHIPGSINLVTIREKELMAEQQKVKNEIK